jgi:hypothetical protein
MPYFDRFDICEAHYLYFCHWHDGTVMYARYSTQFSRLQFRPAPGLDLDTLTDNGRQIYNQLVAQQQFPELAGLIGNALDGCAANDHSMVQIKANFRAPSVTFACVACKRLLKVYKDRTIDLTASCPSTDPNY